MRLILVRHGDAHAGFHGVIGGVRGCLGLTDLGRRQADALRARLAGTPSIRPDVLLSSTLPRAIETAQLIAPALGLDIGSHDDDLCEVRPGDADGLTWAEYDVHHGSFDMETEPDRIFAPAGESWNSFHDRVQRTLVRFAKEYGDQTVLAVCHAGVIIASLRILLGMPRAGGISQLRPTNTGLTDWTHDPGRDRWTLHTFNDAAHLVGFDDEPVG
jgi:probable phosphoglycerate mutase